MEIKTFEVVDRSTLIPALGILVTEPTNASEAYLMNRAGYSCHVPCVLFGALGGGRCFYDPYDWLDNPRTMQAAHKFVAENWQSLESGAIIDVEFILNETQVQKRSERFTEVAR